MNDTLLEQLKSSNPELYQAMLEETQKLQQSERELQQKLEELEEQKQKLNKTPKPVRLYSQRNFSRILYERYGNELIVFLEKSLKSYLIENLQQDGFKELDDSEQDLYTRRLLAYLSRKVESPDKLKPKPSGEAVSLFD